MFTPEERTRLRDALIARARADERITGAALTGSASRDAEDRWSDIDLALGVAAGADLGPVMADWTGVLYREHGALDHLDVVSGAVVYRVFLLASTLQVDIAFAPEDEFGPRAPTFRLLFGRAADRLAAAARTAEAEAEAEAGRAAELIGMAWLYALHARSSLARGRVWQAEYMISGVRDHVLALACVRHGVPAVQGRGMDQLPAEVTAGFAAALVRSVDGAELERAFRAVTESLIAEIGLADAGLAGRLTGVLRELAGGPPSAESVTILPGRGF
jgi:predicted nucleotidyltransferase